MAFITDRSFRQGSKSARLFPDGPLAHKLARTTHLAQGGKPEGCASIDAARKGSGPATALFLTVTRSRSFCAALDLRQRQRQHAVLERHLEAFVSTPGNSSTTASAPSVPCSSTVTILSENISESPA